jgi:hypothetical protein
LVIAEATVEVHVMPILDKLGFRSRSQVAVWAVEHKLTKPPEKYLPVYLLLVPRYQRLQPGYESIEA